MVRYLIIILMIGIYLPGCAPTTELIASWTNQEMEGRTYNSIIVAALTQNIRAKQTVENDFAEALRATGVVVGESSKIFAPNFTDDMLDKEEMLQEIREEGYDAILTVSLLDEETESRYVPGNYNYVPVTRFMWYGNFWGYYTTMYPNVYQPGYYVEDKSYFIETNLYDAATEQLVWSGQSRTYNPSGLEKFSEQFTQLMIQELQKDVRLGR